MTLILAQKKRKLIRDIVIKDVNDATVVPGTHDVVRVKIGRQGSVPVLDLDSAAASANGSTVTKNYGGSSGTNRVQITQADMDMFQPGVYTLEVSMVDNADSQAIKHVDSQVFVVQGVPLGDVGVA